MMTRTAGGPGLVSPLDFNSRPRARLNRNTWFAIGIVALAHVGVGLAVYYQRFELRGVDQAQPEPRPFDVIMAPPPKVIPLEPMQPAKPVPPNAPVHQTPRPSQPVETFTAVPGPSTLPSNTITLAVPVPLAIPNAAPATPEPARPPAVITRPRWASQPSAAQMERAFPRGALTDGVSGVAAMNCLVSASGGLSDCAIVSETPRGQGFGRAANSLTRYFRMSPGTVDGQPIDGARVAFTVRFAVSD
jgi:protein TonB